MALIVEDGSVVAGAESYLSVTDADAYWAKFNEPTTWSGATEAEREAHLRSATRWLDANYRWRGFIESESQLLGWPRVNVVDREGRDIAEDSVPQQVKDATAEMAHQFVLGTVTEIVESGKQVIETQVGPIRQRFAEGQSRSVNAQGLAFNADPGRNTKVFATVDALLRGLTRSPLRGTVPVRRRG